VPTTRQVGDVPELVRTVRANRVVVLPGDTLTGPDVRRLSWSLEGQPVSLGLACPLTDVARHRIEVASVGSTTVLDLTVPSGSPGRKLVKGLVDRTLALVLLVLLAPLLGALWLAVRLESTGPGFFVQTRTGRDGRPFRMYKLRTMCADAEARKAELEGLNDFDSTLFKIRRDPRVTRVGQLLRKSSLDELPQLINVLRGEMSLVGPRPALPNETAAYTPDARRRLVVKPGITGLWQVSGRSDLSWQESLRLDLYYTDNGRLVDDLAIAARTVRAVVKARGAY
jgi:exopolysaccharide biosynthesis polyprenyl glycosylphosphotransferase